jgi:hypothetical protein
VTTRTVTSFLGVMPSIAIALCIPPASKRLSCNKNEILAMILFFYNIHCQVLFEKKRPIMHTMMIFLVPLHSQNRGVVKQGTPIMDVKARGEDS